MTDLERFGRHVGEQHAIEFWRLVREYGWERWIAPNLSWTRDVGPLYRLEKPRGSGKHLLLNSFT
jgi:hypothetical protein